MHQNKVASNPQKYLLLILLAFSLLGLMACNEEPAAVPITPQETPQATLAAVENTPTPLPPTATPLPPTPTPQIAVLVNGQPIILDDLNRELARYGQAHANVDENANLDDAREVVTNALIEQELIQQAANAQGLAVSPAEVDAKIAELREKSPDFDGWLAENLWDEAEFRTALAKEMLTAVLIETITADIPNAVEQVHARYIQVDDAVQAQSLLDRINAGEDFAALATRFSRDQITSPQGGDLGYFARGSLLVPELETAVFALQPDETSEVISVTDPESGTAVHYLIQLIERDPSRPLTAEMRHQLLQERFETWLAEQWDNAIITVLSS